MMLDGLEGRTFDFVRCTECAFIYLHPPVPLSQIGDYYPASYLPHRGAEAWGKYAWLAKKGARKEVALRLKCIEALGVNGKGALLDVGCGRPDFILAVQAKWGWNVKGIDFSDHGWKNERFKGLDLQKGDLGQIDFSSLGKFDVITLWHCLEHDYSPRTTLQNLRGASHQNTRLVIEVPNYDSWSRRRQGPFWQGFHTPRHTGVYTPSTLERMLEQSGWKIEKHYTYGSLDAFVLWWLGDAQRREIRWDGSLEEHFIGFLLQKALSYPLFALQNWLSLGVQTAVAIPA